MKLIGSVLLAFAVTLCISENEAGSATSNTIQTSTHFVDLPVEILLDIFDQLKFEDLISLAETHPHNRDVVDIIMKREISNETVKIYNESPNKFLILCTCTNGQSTRLNFASTLYFLRSFGHHITRLLINFKRNGLNSQQKELFKSYICKYAGPQLEEIDFDFGFMEKQPLMDFQCSFPQAKFVRLCDGSMASSSKFQQLFPAVESLDIAAMKWSSNDLNVHLPKLERLIVPEEWNPDASYFEFLKQTLHHNPQIKHLSLRICSWSMVQFLNKIQPNLESLEISQLTFRRQYEVLSKLRFSEMKVFKCIISSRAVSLNITELFEFGNLEEIEFNRSEFTDGWIRILLQNRNLKKVAFKDPLWGSQLQPIVNGLPNLEEIQFKFHLDMFIRLDEMVEIMLDKSKKLKLVSFLDWRSSCEKFSRALTNQWETVKDADDKEVCILVRK